MSGSERWQQSLFVLTVRSWLCDGPGVGVGSCLACLLPVVTVL